MIKVSIITTTYNSAETVASTIESVLSQTYPNIEYWIIDGNSSDRTLDIIKNIRNALTAGCIICQKKTKVYTMQ